MRSALRVSGPARQLLGPRYAPSAGLSMSVLTSLVPVPAPICLSDFQGGSWALVRRTPGTLFWHQANDNLAGTAVYGTYGTETSTTMFSIAWSTWSFTEMLFMTGKASLHWVFAFYCMVHLHGPISCFVFLGDRTNWMIINKDQLPVGNEQRQKTILKSSLFPNSTCTQFLLIAHT